VGAQDGGQSRLSPCAVERHLENIYRKTGAANCTAASAWAIRNGLV
jgi:DNA-binding CsgD family transcriptional regulator